MRVARVARVATELLEQIGDLLRQRADAPLERHDLSLELGDPRVLRGDLGILLCEPPLEIHDSIVLAVARHALREPRKFSTGENDFQNGNKIDHLRELKTPRERLLRPSSTMSLHAGKNAEETGSLR